MSLEMFQNWVVETGLAISLLIALILIIRRPFARAFGANAAYALWSLPLIRLCLPGVTVPEKWIPGFIRNTASGIMDASKGEFSAIPALPPRDIIETKAGLQSASFEFFTLTQTLVAAWLSIAVLWLGYQFFQQFKFKARLVSESQLPSSALMSEIQTARAQAGLKKTPDVRLSTQNIGPLVTGVFNPLVILPQNFEGRFDARQRNFALIHEFSHIKRFDLWVALTALIFRGLNWPNPLVHYASHKLRVDQEAACDAFVVKVTGGETAHSYAETLVKAVKQTRGLAKPNSYLALSLTQTDTKISKGD